MEQWEQNRIINKLSIKNITFSLIIWFPIRDSWNGRSMASETTAASDWKSEWIVEKYFINSTHESIRFTIIYSIVDLKSGWLTIVSGKNYIKFSFFYGTVSNYILWQFQPFRTSRSMYNVHVNVNECNLLKIKYPKMIFVAFRTFALLIIKNYKRIQIYPTFRGNWILKNMKSLAGHDWNNKVFNH